MNIKTALSLSLAAVAAVGVSSPASAEGENPNVSTPTASIMFPVYHSSANTVVALDTRANKRWQVRAVARGIDAQLPNVSIVFGSCATTPHDLCIKTFTKWYTQPEMDAKSGVAGFFWAGIMMPGESWDSANREIHLNTRQRGKLNRQLVVAHELGHALGLAHHDDSGILGPDLYAHSTPTLAPGEVAALNAWYAVPQVKPEPTPVPVPEVTTEVITTPEGQN